MRRLFGTMMVAAIASCVGAPQPRRTPPQQAAASAASAPSASAAPAASSAVVETPEPPMGTCEEAAELSVVSSPAAPWKGAPLRVMVIAEKPLEGELTLVGPDGARAASRERHGGPPYWWTAEIAAPAAGTWTAKLVRDRAPAECKEIAREIAVRDDAPPRPRATWSQIWPITRAWNRAIENLYSAWIEKLFDAPIDKSLSYAALHEVLRDRSRNFLFNHLGLGEDEAGIVIRPDCADLPYFLRAYFAFKLALPFGYSSCSRGGGGAPPTCPGWAHNQDLEASKRPGLTNAFGHFLRWTLADAVHSGSGRAPNNDDKTDYYPVALGAETLRPGTIYADPYGHILVLVRRVPQTPESGGVFLAVDGQPDGTIGRKRFWRGNFLFAQDPALGSPGFKRFRPVVREPSGAMRRMTNDEIAKSAEYKDFSLEQSSLSIEAFYDKMDDVMSPSPLDPMRAMKETIVALEEQVKARVTSVENGRKFQTSGRGLADMPDGATIFETNGAWEDFATPSRDLRLLIAIDVVRGFPDRVARRADRYAMPKDKAIADVKAELEKTLAAELQSRKITYTRSDGTAFTLSLQDVVDRSADLEMAYNPNDCVELRWGAPASSDEAATCKRHASPAQRLKMTKYRAWFHERRRPPRD